jgi:hypothetical protein
MAPAIVVGCVVSHARSDVTFRFHQRLAGFVVMFRRSRLRCLMVSLDGGEYGIGGCEITSMLRIRCQRRSRHHGGGPNARERLPAR